MNAYSSSNKDRITFNGIRSLWKVLQSTELKQESFIRSKYNELATDYLSVRGLFELLGFIRLDEGKLIPINSFKSFLEGESSGDIEEFKSLVRGELLAGDTHSSSIDEFVSIFHRADNNMVVKLTIDERLKYSDLRNLFVELDILEYLPDFDAYQVNETLRKRFRQTVKNAHRSILTPERLAEVLLNQEQLGKEAELKVLEHEQSRLKDFPHLGSTIDHTALYDVSAGYDIASWEVPTIKNQRDVRRYIEVKAVSDKDFRFMWSSNEIECALKLKSRYYLYLLPVLSSGKFDISKIQIIADPYNNVFMDKKVWTKSPNVYTIWKVGESNEEPKNS